MADQFMSVDAFENEVSLILRALKDLGPQEGAVQANYSKLEAECKQNLESRKNEAKNERLREASAAKGHRTEQERKAHEQYGSDLKELTASKQRQIAAVGKEYERRRLTLETSHDWQMNEARRRAGDETVRLQESVGEAEVEAENRIRTFTEVFEQDYDVQLLNDVKDYLAQVKSLTGAVAAEGCRSEQERQQVLGQTSYILDREAKNAEEIRRLAVEMDAYVQGIPRTFTEHSALHIPVKLNRGHNALPAPFKSTAEALNQMQSYHATVAAIYTRLQSLNKEVGENQGKAVAIVAGVGCLFLLILVLLWVLLFR